MIVIGRPIQGVTINGNEYVCDKDGRLVLFQSEEDARVFLHGCGISDEEIENEGIVFEEEGDIE